MDSGCKMAAICKRLRRKKNCVGAECVMKKTWVIIVNVFIMIAMLIFVVLNSNLQSKDTAQRQIEHFENTTITMERVTENYLEANSASAMCGHAISTARR